MTPAAQRIRDIALTNDGYFELPAAPGLGVTIRKDLYEK
jgi:L-alanine-DL-glutamate epimerase-like enolase superfamily enzyme